MATYAYRWPSGSVVSKPGATHHGRVGYYWWGTNTNFNYQTFNGIAEGNGWYFVTTNSQNPVYDSPANMANSDGPFEWVGGGDGPGQVGSTPEGENAFIVLAQQGSLIGRPNTQYAGLVVTSTRGPLTSPQQQQLPQQLQQLPQQPSNNNPFNFGGSPMATNSIPLWILDWMKNSTLAFAYRTFLITVSGNLTPLSPASGSTLAVIYAAAGDATNAAAQAAFEKAKLQYESQARFIESQDATFRALASGDQMAMWMAFMQQQQMLFTGGVI